MNAINGSEVECNESIAELMKKNIFFKKMEKFQQMLVLTKKIRNCVHMLKIKK